MNGFFLTFVEKFFCARVMTGWIQHTQSFRICANVRLGMVMRANRRMFKRMWGNATLFFYHYSRSLRSILSHTPKTLSRGWIPPVIIACFLSLWRLVSLSHRLRNYTYYLICVIAVLEARQASLFTTLSWLQDLCWKIVGVDWLLLLSSTCSKIA